jgi:two-component system CheB/CheR fusion protein
MSNPIDISKLDRKSLEKHIMELEEELISYKNKLQQQELLTSTENINNALDTSNAPIFSIDIDGNISIWNQGIARITGYSFNDVDGIKLQKIIPADKKHIYNQIIKRILKGQRLAFEEITIKTTIDTEVNILSNPTAIKNVDGKIIGCIFIGQDITERKLIAAALRESENFYRRITENSSDFILIYNSNYQIDYISPSVTNILGYSIEEFIELRIKDITLPEDYATFETTFQKFISNQIFEYILDLPIKHKDGSWKVIEVVAQNYLKDPILNGIVLRSRNITERKETEEILEFERNQLLKIFDSIPNAIYIADPVDYTLLFANLFVRETIGYDPVGKKCHQVFLNSSLPCPRCTNKELFENNGKPIQYVFRNPMLKRNYMMIDQFIKWLDGRTVRFSVATDITELKRTQRELEDKNKLLEQKYKELENFAYFASHDLPEPLRMVSTYLSLFERRYKGHLDEKADLYIHYAVDGANRMNEMIKALLKYSRVDKEQNFREFDVNQKISEALNNLKVTIDESKAKITVDIMPKIYGEPALFTQVIQNLVSNSIKFCEKDPIIHISLKNLEKAWEFKVSDNGIGIEERYFDQIFNFKRLHPLDKYPGSGIGLPLCKKILLHHNGSIWLESRRGEGTTFYFTIPKQKEDRT